MERRAIWKNVAFSSLGIGLLLFVVLGGALAADSFLEPHARIDLSFPYRGVLAELKVREGDTVQKGQVVAALDSRVLQATLRAARKMTRFHGKIDSAKALLDLRRSRLQGLEALMKSGNARQREVERARTDLAMAEAGLQIAIEEKEVNVLEYKKILAQIEERKLRSPIRGVVLRIYKQAAELVGGLESRPLMTVAQLNPLKAVFHLSPEKAACLKRADTVAITVVGRGEPVTATVDAVSPAIEPDSGTVRITLLVPNNRGTLMSGTRCALILP